MQRLSFGAVTAHPAFTPILAALIISSGHFRLENAMLRWLLAFLLALSWYVCAAAPEVVVQSFALPDGGGSPHDVAVGADGIVWYTAQRDGKLGRLDPVTGQIDLIPLGAGAAPHGVIIGPDGARWITEDGTNAKVSRASSTGGLRGNQATPWNNSVL